MSGIGRRRPAVLTSGDVEVTLTPIEDRRSDASSTYEASIDGELIGHVWKQPFNREKRTGNNRYVDRRWNSPPIWTWKATERVPGHRAVRYELEASSRQNAVDRLVRDHERIVSDAG